MTAPFTVRPNRKIARAAEDYIQFDIWQLEKVEIGLKEADAGAFALEEEVARVRDKFTTLR